MKVASLLSNEFFEKKHRELLDHELGRLNRCIGKQCGTTLLPERTAAIQPSARCFPGFPMNSFRQVECPARFNFVLHPLVVP